MPPLLAIIAAIPRAAVALESIAKSLETIGQRIKEEQAAKRRGEKDEMVDSAINLALSGGMRDEEEREREPLDF